MAPPELQASLIAERELSVAALPYADVDDEEDTAAAEYYAGSSASSERSSGTEAGGVHVELHPLQEESESRGPSRANSDGDYQQQQQHQHSQKPRNVHSSPRFGAPTHVALHSPVPLGDSSAAFASSSYASSGPSCASGLNMSEFPLCPSSCPGVRVHVFLAANDDITPSASIHAYLSAASRVQVRKWGASMLRCAVFPGVGHAEAMFHPRFRYQILDAIQTQRTDRQMRAEAERQNSGRAGNTETTEQ